jgi:hypothetical protein
MADDINAATVFCTPLNDYRVNRAVTPERRLVHLTRKPSPSAWHGWSGAAVSLLRRLNELISEA